MRSCEICSGTNLQNVHRQHFLFADQPKSVYYNVVACVACGFTFASDIPSQSELNLFYQTSEHHLHTELPPGLARMHSDFFQFVMQHADVSPDTRILDIGSGIGHFLQNFKTAGFRSLLGIEPSPASSRLAKEMYGLEIQATTISTFRSEEKFDLITISGVLEHIADLRDSLHKISTLLQDQGLLFVAVPDAAAFGAVPPAEPFLEFALEHINFFGPVSLDNLLRRAGLERVATESHRNDFYGNSALLALYRKSPGRNMELLADHDSVSSLIAYVDYSRQKLLPIICAVEQLVDSHEPLIIWGAGSLTSRLFCDTNLDKANILSIVDRSANLQGKKLLNVPISAPESIKENSSTTVLIASTSYASEIYRMLVDQYSWIGRIIVFSPNLY